MLFTFLAITYYSTIGNACFLSFTKYLFHKDTHRNPKHSKVRVFHPPDDSGRDMIPLYSGSECVDIMEFLPIEPTNQLLHQCKSRFYALYSDHVLHQQTLHKSVDKDHKNNNSKKSSTNLFSTKNTIINSKKSRLIVLDVDETILDQGSFVSSDIQYQSDRKHGRWKRINDKELMVNGNRCPYHNNNNDHHKTNNNKSLTIGIFRKNLMEFIRFAHNQNDDIMLYSLGSTTVIIYHAVFMELYYNMVFVDDHSMDNGLKPPLNADKTKEFHFKAVVSRPDDFEFPRDGFHWRKKPKSLMTVVKAMGNHKRSLDQYQAVIVVDDQLERVWNKKIPLFINLNTFFLWVTPSEFYLKTEKEFVNSSVVDQLQDERTSDVMFRRLTKMLKKMSTEEVIKERSMNVMVPEMFYWRCYHW